MRKRMSLIIALFCISFCCVEAYSVSKSEQMMVSLSANEGRTQVSVNERLDSYPTISREIIASVEKVSSPKRVQGPMKIGPTGSTIVGWRSFDEPKGWFELATDGTETMLWQNFDLEPAAGFIKDGKLYSYYAKYFFGTLYMSYFVNDLQTGETLESGSFDETDYSKYVLICAYDKANDIAYAYTYSADAETNWLQKIDPNTQEFTKICEPSVAPRLITYYPVDGRIYGISKAGELIRLNTENGDLEVVGHTGFSPSIYKQTMVYSPIDKKFIWAALIGDDLAACVIAVDPITGEGEKIADLPLYTEYNILETLDVAPEEDIPASPEILSVEFEKASLNGSVTIRTPKQLFGGEDMEDGTELVLISYLDEVEHSRQTTTINTELIINFNDISQGMHTFSFEVAMNDKVSPQVSATQYIGYDIPVAPKNVVLETNLVSWDSVTEGVNGGYIDQENMFYDIYINEIKQNSTPVSGNSYSIELPGGDMTSYWADVVAVCHDLYSEKGTSNKIVYGDAFEIPVSFLPDPDQVDLFTIKDANEDGNTWFYDYNRYAFEYIYSQHYDADDWIFLPVIKFDDAETYYEFNLEAWAFNENFPESFELAFGTSQDPGLMNVIAKYENIKNTEPNIYSTIFKVSEPGLYYVGIHVISPVLQYNLFVRNMSIKKSLVTSESPTAFTDLSVVAADKGELKALISCKMPTKNIKGDDLDPNKEMKLVASSSVSTAEIIAKTGEDVVNMELTTIQGSNDVVIALYDGDIKVYETKIAIYTGLAVPGPISKLKATASEDNYTVHVSWNPPTYGITEGYFDPSTVKYYYYDYIWGTGWTKLSELGSDCEFDLELDPGTELHAKYIAVVSANEVGENPSMPYATIVLGAPYEAPMKEEFTNGAYTYSPILVLAPDTYHNAVCVLGDPSEYLSECKSEDGCSLISYTGDMYYNSYGLLSIPKFTTKGLEDPIFKLNAWIGDATAKTEIYAESNDVESTLIGSFEAESVNEWREIEMPLPESLWNKGWVEIKIKSYYFKDLAYSIIDGYSLTSKSVGSVEDIMAEIAVYSEEEKLVVKGAEGLFVNVYTIDGRRIYSSEIANDLETIGLQSGIYIVRVGREVSKIVIK